MFRRGIRVCLVVAAIAGGVVLMSLVGGRAQPRPGGGGAAAGSAAPSASIVATKTSVQPAHLDPTKGGRARSSDVHSIRLHLSKRVQRPPAGMAATVREHEGAPATRVAPGPSLDARPSAERVRAPATNGPQAPNDFVEFRVATPHTSIGGAGASEVAEPSVATSGPTTFLTWNWGAALSQDGGDTWSFYNPYQQFPTSYGGFCCDQVVIHDPVRGLYIWVLQYVADASNNNALRVAVANGAAGLAAGAFRYFDITPQQIGAPSGRFYDQPKLALTHDHLFLEASQYTTVWQESVVMRISLASLATQVSGGSMAYDYYPSTTYFSPGLAQGAVDKMFFAAHDVNKLSVWEWPDSALQPLTHFYANHSPDPPKPSYYSCPRTGATDLAKSDWCRRPSGAGFAHDNRIHTGWVANGQVGFSWDAPQGTAPTIPTSTVYPYPHVHMLVMTEDTSGTVTAEPIIWNPTLAFSYATIAPNARGDLGGSVVYGGGSSGAHLACGILFHDSLTTGGPYHFDLIAALGSGDDTTDSTSGDYLTARGNGGNPNTWSSSCYRLKQGNGSVALPYYFSFGREKDSPIKTLTVSTSAGGSVTSNPAGIACSPTCSKTFWQGETVALTPLAQSGFVFKRWSGACSGSTTCNVTMDASKTVTATFVHLFPLTVIRDGTGSGSVSGAGGAITCGTTCSSSFADGSTVTLTATPRPGSVFRGWSGSCSGLGACTVSVTAATTVRATFTRILAAKVGTRHRDSLRLGPALVKRLRSGVYLIRVVDRSRKDNFHLKGPGVNKKTSVRGRARKTWIVNLKRGATYRYRSDAGGKRTVRKFKAS